MKYIFSLVLFASLLCSRASAQAKISLGLESGIFIPGLGLKSDNPVLDGYKSQLAPSFGLVLETGINNKWSLLTELNYSDIRITKNGSQVIPKSAYENLNLSSFIFSDYLYATFESKIKIKYVEVPLMLKYYLKQNEKMNFFINGGGFAGILFYGDLKTKGQGNIYTDAAQTKPLFPRPFPQTYDFNQPPPIQDRLNPINIGLQAGAGCTLIGNVGDFFASVNGAFGLMNMQVDKGDGENKSKELNVCIGYLFHLSK